MKQFLTFPESGVLWVHRDFRDTFGSLLIHNDDECCKYGLSYSSILIKTLVI